MSTRALVLGGYRRLLRASRLSFEGDTFALQQARLTLRNQFLDKSVISDPKAQEEMLKGIDEAESMLLHHIVQGKRVDKSDEPSRFKVKLTDPQKKNMSQNEELTPVTLKSTAESIIIHSGNACTRPQ
ncbi:unnamed protein product [Albugo candida]|uniref:Mitochondrial zinc maintenance protein 1, mitochondrial n=1 Tax=Albugo candida TaxID=65357 RepID=A0A024FXZ4_9STRA|nr:unnamed protein product [Albugo candida]|eukprot:CCI39439.1 unnamed protein product [Albugo candida]